MDITTKKEVVKLNHIDQLRGIAILLVVMIHVYQSQLTIKGSSILLFNFGGIGVQLFFLLSAYTLCLSMSARRETSWLRSFYIRRVFRIAPLYYLGILIYFLVSNFPLINLGGPLSHSGNYTILNILCSVFFIHGLVPAANNTIVPGGWSIGTEMIFYLIFPAVFVLYERMKQVRFLLLLPLIALLMAQVYIFTVYGLIGTEGYTNIFYYYNILNQIPVFAVGITYFFLEKAGLVTITKNKALISFVVLICISFVLMFKLKTNLSLAIFVASISFCFLFKVFKELKLSLPLLTRIGQLSFSIYIFHFLFAYPLVSKIVALAPAQINPYLLYAITYIITVALSMLVATVSEKLIEKPGINMGKRLIKGITVVS